MNNRISTRLPGDFPWQVHWFETIDSTNTRLKAMAANGAPHGTVLAAGHQTGGRGRLGRSFHSPAGAGIYLSVLLRPNCRAEQLMHLTCAAAVAACDALETACGYRPGVKWINDLVANGKKLGGILTELSVDPSSGLVSYAIIGIGINCAQAPSDFPDALQNIATSLLAVTGKQPNQEAVAAALIHALFKMDAQLLEKQADIMAQYRRDCVTLGRQILVIEAAGTQPGTALKIDDRGGLVVRLDDGTVKSVSSGEVSVRGIMGYV